MHRRSTKVRLPALALAAAIAVTLASTIASHMPPPAATGPNEARLHAAPIEVAIVPARIEVIGVRGVDTARTEAPVVSAPRS